MAKAQTLWDWLQANVLVVPVYTQLFVAVTALLLAVFFAGSIKGSLERTAGKLEGWRRTAVQSLIPISTPVLATLITWMAEVVAIRIDHPHKVLAGITSLLVAWVVIRLSSGLIRNKGIAKYVSLMAWTVAALHIVDLLDPAITFLNDIAINFGDFRLSVLGVIQGVIAIALLLWLAGFISRQMERRIEASTSLTPSIKVLLTKVGRFSLFILAFVLALKSIGVDLTGLTIFSGAVGVGIGFGLKTVFSNLISGVILLLDKSVKPGDVVAIDDTYGWINSLHARYVSVITRDGIEHLIPNEQLIGQKVENWSYTDSLVRIRLPIGVSYDSDIHRVIELCIEAASSFDRILKEPAPRCLLKGFGDNSVDLELRLWVSDPQNGLGNIRSDIYLKIWDTFKEYGVEIPYPQRDLHIKGPVQVESASKQSEV